MKVEVDSKNARFDLADGKVGDVAIVYTALSIQLPATLLKTYDGWVSLERPNETWEKFEPKTQYGFLLPKGTKITLTVE